MIRLVYLHSRKKEGASTFLDSMDETGENYAKWNKSGGEWQITYDLTYKWTKSTKQTSMQNITGDIEIKNKLTVTREEWLGR